MLIDLLHQQFSNLGDLRMREIRVDKQQRKVFCTLSYPASPYFDNDAKTQITDFVRSRMPKGYLCSVKFAEDVFTVNSFIRNLSDYIKEYYPVFSNIGKQRMEVRIDGKQIYASLKVDAVTRKNMELTDFCQKLSEHYAEYTSYTVEFALISDEGNITANVSEQEKLVRLAINRELLRPTRFFNISGQRALFGKNIAAMPMYISDLRKPMDSCNVCGKVSSKSCRKAKNNPLLYVCSFTLTDGTGGSLPCVLFVRMQITDVETIMSETGRGEAEAKTLSEKRSLANDKKLKDILWLSDNMDVAAHGKVVYGQSGQLEMHVYDLCTCKIDPISSEREFNREVAPEYLLVKPEDCTEFRQINFVDNLSQTSLLSGKSYVVLHVNSTGFGNIIEDRLYAICAVKLLDGHVRERFFTYVNPEKELSDERALEQCGLTSAKLIFYPTLTEIISDLYKFVYGSSLVGNNLTQILQLLNYYAAPMNYRFDNPAVSQIDLLGQLFENSTLEVTVNLAKLDDVAKKCKISCPNGVFCRDTAMTVARCMSMLSGNAK